MEFKSTEEGQSLENRIRERRNLAKEMRGKIKTVTNQLNSNKSEIDELKMRLDRKEEERKLRSGYDAFGTSNDHDMFDNSAAN